MPPTPFRKNEDWKGMSKNTKFNRHNWCFWLASAAECGITEEKSAPGGISALYSMCVSTTIKITTYTEKKSNFKNKMHIISFQMYTFNGRKQKHNITRVFNSAVSARYRDKVLGFFFFSFKSRIFLIPVKRTRKKRVPAQSVLGLGPVRWHG